MPSSSQHRESSWKKWIRKNRTKIKQVQFNLNVIFSVFTKFFLFLIAFGLLVGGLLLGIGTGYFAYLVSQNDPPSKTQLEKKINNFDEISHIVYASGENIATISSDVVRTYVPSKEISPYLKKAIIATEDENFKKHNGIVPKAIARAVISDITGLGSASGGSTLTQQLVKQQILNSETTFKRKANEILLALRVDKYFSKDEIVTAYLNVSPFGRNNKGQNIAGVQEAAKGIFGISAKELTLAQAAFIAGLPQSPIVYSPYLNDGTLKKDITLGLKRKDFVLFSMLREKSITKKEYNAARKVNLKKQFIPQEEKEKKEKNFLYFTMKRQAIEAIMKEDIKKDGANQDKVFKDTNLYNRYYTQAQRELEREGYTVHTTIDYDIQRALSNTITQYGAMLDDGRGAYVENGGVLMDNKTGRVYGFIAGRDFNTSQNNHAFDTKRPPGSTIKPVLVYGPALDIGLIGTQTKLSNFKTHYKEDPKIEIQNAGVPPDNTFHSAIDSLTNSLNIPTYHLYQAIMEKINPATQYMAKMKYDVPEKEFLHESSALGQMDMTVFDQTKAFATIANNGKYNEGFLIDKIVDNKGKVIYKHKQKETSVYSAPAATILQEMMRSVVDKGTGFTAKAKLNGSLQTGDWIGKTGTTSDSKDFWFIGSTPGVTYSSWIGYDDGTPMSENNSDNNMAFWAYAMNAVYQVNPDIFETQKTFKLDDRVTKAEVSNFSGEKKATFDHNGKTYTTPGTLITSHFATNKVPKTTYEFGIGGTKENYDFTWKNRFNQNTTSTNSSRYTTNTYTTNQQTTYNRSNNGYTNPYNPRSYTTNYNNSYTSPFTNDDEDME